MLENILLSGPGLTFLGFVFAAAISFTLGVLVDRKIIEKDTKDQIKGMKQAALREYVENAEKGVAKDLAKAYLKRRDVDLDNLEDEVKN